MRRGRAAGTVVVAPTRRRYERAAALIDGLLVALAEETSSLTALTLDGRGFDAYRTAAGDKFKRLP